MFTLSKILYPFQKQGRKGLPSTQPIPNSL